MHESTAADHLTPNQSSKISQFPTVYPLEDRQGVRRKDLSLSGVGFPPFA